MLVLVHSRKTLFRISSLLGTCSSLTVELVQVARSASRVNTRNPCKLPKLGQDETARRLRCGLDPAPLQPKRDTSAFCLPRVGKEEAAQETQQPPLLALLRADE